MSAELTGLGHYVTAALRESDHAVTRGRSGASRPIQEEIWALPLPLPMFAYLVRPVSNGPFPLVIMNHGVSLNPTGRSFFPLVEFATPPSGLPSAATSWWAPVGTGYGAAAIDIPEHGLYGPFFSKVGKCNNPNFRAPGLAVAQVDLWIIDYMTAEKRIVPKDVIVVGQSAGGWASIALSSLNPPQVKAIITFAVRVDIVEREGDGTARLQVFSPVGMYLPKPANLTVDQGQPYSVPYAWCLTNACIAGTAANPKIVSEMASGQTLRLAFLDSGLLTLTTSLPLGRFASAHKGAPAQTFEQEIDE